MRVDRKSTTTLPAPSRVVELALSTLKEAPYNPRRITGRNLENLAASLDRFGYVEPIVVNLRRRGSWRSDWIPGPVVVGGHQRLRLLRERGVQKATVVAVDLGLREEKALNVALNNPHAQGTFEIGPLADLMRSIEDPALLRATGFDEASYSRLLGLEKQVAASLEERVPCLPKKPTTRRGQVLTLSRHRLMCGDATKPSDVAALLGDSNPTVILTDPPYGAALDTDWTDVKGSRKAQLTHLSAIKGKHYERTIGDEAPFDPAPLFSVYGSPREVLLFGADYYCARIPNLGKGSWLVWGKRPEGCEDAIGSMFELIWSKRRRRRLITHLLALCSRPGDVVVDPYMGSGTTLVACERLNRTCLGMEIDPRYCDVAAARWRKECDRLRALADGGEA